MKKLRDLMVVPDIAEAELRARAEKIKFAPTCREIANLIHAYPGTTREPRLVFELLAPKADEADVKANHDIVVNNLSRKYGQTCGETYWVFRDADPEETIEAYALRHFGIDASPPPPPIGDAPVAAPDPEVRVSPSPLAPPAPPATGTSSPVLTTHAHIPADAAPDLAPDLYSGLVVSESALARAGFDTTCTIPRRLHARAYRTFEHAGITNFMEDKRDGLRQAQYAGWDPQMATSILKRLGSLVVAAIKAAPGPGPEKADCFLLLGLIIVEINDYLEKHEAEAASEAEAPGVRCQKALWNKLKSEGWTWRSGAGPDWYVRPGVWERIPGLERNVDYFSMEELCEYADAHGLWPTRETTAPGTSLSAPAAFYTTAPGGN